MKTAAKVFIIIGMIVGCLGILPLVMGIIALKQMKDHKPSTGICVCVLLFCSLLGGIFLLCANESEWETNEPEHHRVHNDFGEEGGAGESSANDKSDDEF